jgi:hypothetical protein
MTSVSAVIFLTSPRFDMATSTSSGRAEWVEYGYATAYAIRADRADAVTVASDRTLSGGGLSARHGPR